MVTYEVPSVSTAHKSTTKRPSSVEDLAYEPTTSHSSTVEQLRSASSGENNQTIKTRRLKLPISGTIAMRRALKRGLDPAVIEREQQCRLMHELALKAGPLKDVELTFREIDWTGQSSTSAREGGEGLQRRMTRINDGEPVSPKSRPRIEQMSLEEYRMAVGASEKGILDEQAGLPDLSRIQLQ